MGGKSVVQYVRTSSVRTDIVGELCPRNRTTEELLDGLDASESAVYDALSNLERRGLVESMEGEWHLTGTGRLVTDMIHLQQVTEELIGRDEDYWEHHDAAVLPQSFRYRLAELDPYDVVRGTQIDINRPVREVVNRVQNVDGCDIVSPVYHPEYEAAMPDNPESRLVLSDDVIDDVVNSPHIDMDSRRFEETEVRVTGVEFALGVSDEWVILTLPEMGGQWPTAKIISETEPAVSWGRDLFAHLWEDAVPAETYLTDI